MRFLSLSPLATLALVLAVLALVVAAYRLKPGRRRVTVSSFALWAKVLGRHSRVVSRWRWWLSLLLASAIGGALALALSRPEVAGVGGRSQRVLVLMDNSPSMAARTRDGGTRWQHAVSQARALVSSLGGASEVLVMDTMGRAPVAGYVSPAQAWREIGRLPLVTAGRARLPSLPESRGAQRIHWFTDGVALPAAPEYVRVHALYEAADNVGVTVFDARPQPADSTRVQGLVQVTNGGMAEARARLVISGPDYSLTRDLILPPGESVSESLDLSQGDAGVYRAEVQMAGDALATDDVAFAVVPAHGVREVLLVSTGDSRLEDSLRALSGVRLTIMRPAAYRTARDFDAYIFDRYTPARAPTGGTLFIGAPHGRQTQAVGDAVVTAWDTAHPLTRGVAWGDLRLRAAALTAGAGSENDVVVNASALKGTSAGGLVTAGVQGTRWIRMGFALVNSNFTLQPGFPVFLGNAIEWLSQRQPALTRNIGSIAVPVPDATVFDPQGRKVASFGEPAGTRFEAVRPSVFTLKSAAGEWQVAANVLDPDFVRINRSALTSQDLGQGASGRTYVARAEFWTLLLLLAAVLILLEWFTFTRKVTV